MDSTLTARVELVLTAGLPSRERIEQLCRQARDEGYRAVVVPSGSVLLAQHVLEDASVRISCRIGFPNGSVDPDAKRYETELAIDAGAQEIELVPSLAHVQDGDYSAILREIRDIVEAADERPVKVSVEPSLWEEEVLTEVIRATLDSGAQYLCTSQGARSDLLAEIASLRSLCGPEFGILARASDLSEVSEVLAAGADLASIKGGSS